MMIVANKEVEHRIAGVTHHGLYDFIRIGGRPEF